MLKKEYVVEPSNFRRVIEFNHIFGSLESAEIADNFSLDMHKKALALVVEEVGELNNAKDAIDEIDALADIMVVVDGNAARCGIDLEDTLPIKKIINSATLQLQNAASSDEIRATLDKIAAYTLLYAIRKGYNLQAAFNTVCDNNMSKLCADEAEAVATVKHYEDLYAAGKSPYVSPYYTVKDGRFIVRDRQMAKILKAKSWREPQFAE